MYRLIQIVFLPGNTSNAGAEKMQDKYERLLKRISNVSDVFCHRSTFPLVVNGDMQVKNLVISDEGKAHHMAQVDNARLDETD